MSSPEQIEKRRFHGGSGGLLEDARGRRSFYVERRKDGEMEVVGADLIRSADGDGEKEDDNGPRECGIEREREGINRRKKGGERESDEMREKGANRERQGF
ncbi:hypothetical protein L484_006645 [Morus notabilis]|uniref:Uncharacterized protein n=1 Tax=Morus notabilis TaxID=981085 RepID=W9S2A9_9ROSA|nr:hypothetical protein L484_006645 [Morus notabilis]